MDDVVTAYGNRFVVAALGVSLALLCLVVVLWVLKNRAPSPFIRGGRNRNPRLQVLDAAAVDTRRRLVLVRRDNVEHLIMIGGPSDLVIESRIGETDGHGATEIEEEAFSPPQIAAAPAQKQVPEPMPISRPSARGEQRRVPAAQPAPPPAAARQAPVRAAPRPAARPPEPAPPQPAAAAYHQDEHFDLQQDDTDNDFFYDDVYDDGPSEEEELAELLEANRERIFADREAPPAMPARPAAVAPPAYRQGQQASPSQNLSSSDFERVLEEEIALHLAPQGSQDGMSGRTVSQRPAPPSPRTPSVAPPRPIAPPLMARPSDPRYSDDRRPAAAGAPPPRPVPQAAARPVTAPAQRPPLPSRPVNMAAPAARQPSQPNLQNEIARIFGEMSVKREK